MASIFERLMTEGTALTESANVRRKKTCECKKINPKRIKIESRRIFEETDFTELDDQFAGDPTAEEGEGSDEIVLVIDPEIPAEEEVPEDAAEEMIGDAVYKCPVCGSNYVCDCDSLGEGIDVDENGVPTECPICGDDADQILVGEIAPIEEGGEEDHLDPVDGDDAGSEGDDDTAAADDEGASDEDEEIIEEEGLKLTESDEIAGGDEDEAEADVVVDTLDDDADDAEVLVLEPDVEEEDAAPVVEINDSEVTLMLDDTRLESMMSKVIRENYKGDSRFTITRAALREGKLRIEYVVRQGKSFVRGTLLGEGFDRSARAMKIKFVDKGVFTESFAKTPSFIVECVRLRNTITPVSLKYDYKVKVNESLYRIHGKVGK